MNEDSTVVRLRQPEEINDPLTAVLRSGARRLRRVTSLPELPKEPIRHEER